MPRRKKSKAGRPPRAGIAASDVVRLRVTPTEREAWERAAGDLTLSAWIRQLANAAVAPELVVTVGPRKAGAR